MAFLVEKTNKTPEISFDLNKGTFNIYGALFPENSERFFKPLFTYAKEYLQNPNKETKLDVFIYYINTSSSKQLYEFIKLFNDNKEKTEITVNWIYDEDDDDMLETGEEFDSFFKDLNFTFTPQK